MNHREKRTLANSSETGNVMHGRDSLVDVWNFLGRNNAYQRASCYLCKVESNPPCKYVFNIICHPESDATQ